jgi:hypothetical protein
VKAKISSSGEAAGEAVPEKTWYEFQVLDAAGQPMKDEPLKVTLQSGQVIQKKTDADGVVRIEDIDASDVASAELVDRQEGEWADLGAGERRTGAPGSGEAEEGSPPEETEEESSGIESGPAA